MSLVVSGLFRFRDAALTAISRLKEAGFDKLEVMAPVPDHEILEAVKHKPSKVGLMTLLGGITGLIVGFGGASWAHIHWGSIIGGKPVLSVPPFIIVAFELTILFAAVATMAGVILMCRLPSLKLPDNYDKRVTEDCYHVFVETDESRKEQASTILSEAGGEVRL